jgi:large repetitive protein
MHQLLAAPAASDIAFRRARRPGLVAGLLLLAALWLPGIVVGQTIPQSLTCPTAAMSVAHGGTAQLNLDHCGLFGIGPIGTQPTHGSATFSNLGAALVNYTHVGGANVATSDFFTIADEDGRWIWITVAIAAPASAIVIAPSTLPAMVAGTAFSQMLSSSGGIAPYAYSIVSGSLPTGLGLSPAGLISGTPTQRGPFVFTVGVFDAVSDTGSRGYSVSVAGGTLALSPNPPPNAAIGVAYSASFTASGGVAPYALAWEPDAAKPLPPGLSFSGTTLSGTPTTIGNYTFGIRITDSSTGPGAWFQVIDVTMSVTAAPTITVAPTTLPAATVGFAYSQTITGSGGVAPYTYAVTAGALPPGLALAVSTGTLSGTPTAGGSFNFTIRATDANGFNGSRAYSFTVAAATIAIAPATLPAATVGTAYTQTITASGGTAPYSYAITAGALPSGLTLASDGTLAGTATAGGSFNFTVTATDSSTGTGPYTGSRAYAFTVNAPTVALAPATLPSATIATAYSQTISASGGTAPYAYAITAGALPSGLTLASNGAVSGTATAGGSFNFTVTATDSSTGSGPFTGSINYALSVLAPTVTLAPATLPGGTLGAAYSQAITASGGTAPYTYAVSAGTLPAGLTLAVNGTLSGTPSMLGPFNFTVTATDSSGGSGPFTGVLGYLMEITELPPITNPVSATVAYGSGANAITLQIDGGAPVSVAVSAAGNGTAIATGTSVTYQPDTGYAGTDGFTYTATNTAGTSAAAAVSITVSAPTISVGVVNPLTVAVGSPYTQTFTWSGGAAPYSGYTVSGLPAGLAITSTGTSSVTVSGTPTAAGSFTLEASATDSSTGTGPFTLAGDFTLEVTAATPTLSPAAGVLGATAGTAYVQAFIASGGVAPYSFVLTGTLPAGLVFDASTGTLSGTPAAFGTFAITITITDSSTGVDAPFSASSSYTLQIAAASLSISPGTLAAGAIDTAYTQTLVGSGGLAPYTFSVTAGALPAGLTLNATGTLSGTPTASGTFTFDVTVTDGSASTMAQSYVMVIVAAPLIIPATGPFGIALMILLLLVVGGVSSARMR